MIRTNLSTKPFYNERAVVWALFVLAAIVLLTTAFNVTKIVRLSRSDTRLLSSAARDEQHAADLRAQAAHLRSTVDPRQIEFVSREAHKANDLIDRRTFSWTELFNVFETTLPDDVRITSVRPSVDSKNGTVLAITVVAKAVDDVNQFMDNLEKTGAFANLHSADEQTTEQGLLEASLRGKYLPLAGGR
jgi:Tfp pilus assembly protein PilN